MGEGGRKAHRAEKFEQAGLGGHHSNAVAPQPRRVFIGGPQQLPPVAPAAGGRVGGQGVDVIAPGLPTPREGQPVGQQGQHGGQPAVLQQQEHMLPAAAVVKPVDIAVLIAEGRLPQGLLGRKLFRPGRADLNHTDLPFTDLDGTGGQPRLQSLHNRGVLLHHQVGIIALLGLPQAGPPDLRSGGDPFSTSSGEVNPPCGKPPQAAWTRKARPVSRGPVEGLPDAYFMIAAYFSTIRSG